jgi:hypothetical protein
MFNKNKIKLFFILLLLQAGFVLSQTESFSYAGGATYYNVSASEANNGNVTGGILLEVTDLQNRSYFVRANFNSGGWYPINGYGSVGDVNQGILYGQGEFRPYTTTTTSGDPPVPVTTIYPVQISFSHAELASSVGWPGDVEGITFQLKFIDSDNVSFPLNPGNRNFDLVKPTLTSVSIVSNNSNYNC